MQWKNKRVLVTGGAGVIGTELISLLLKNGANVFCLDIEEPIPGFKDDIEFLKSDLADVDSDDIITLKPEIVFHLAASFERTQERLNFWDSNFKDNIMASHSLLTSVKKCHSIDKFVFASSYLVYSPDLYLFDEPPEEAVELDEDDRIKPRNLTGAAKYYTENELRILTSFDEVDFKPISARIYRVYGRGSRDIVSRWIRAACADKEVKMYNKENRFDFIHARDVAKGLFKLAESPRAEGIINLGSGKSNTIFEIKKIISQEFGDFKVEDLGRKGPIEASKGKISKLKSLTGWAPDISLEKGIRDIISFERKRK